MTTFYLPTDDWATWRLRNINRQLPVARGVTSVEPYPAYTPLRDSLPPPPRLQPAGPDRERRLRVERRRRDEPVLFDRRSGDDRRAVRSVGPRIDVYC